MSIRMPQPNVSPRGPAAPRRGWAAVVLAALIGTLLVADADLVAPLASATTTDAPSVSSGGIKVPPGKSPARVLRSRRLNDGTKVVTVPFEDTFLLDGRRVAYVEEYKCVKTLIGVGGVRVQRTAHCLPAVEIAPPLKPS
jgi:hypothetical protein